MKDIKLVKPVVVRASLKDMCPKAYDQAERLLYDVDVINGNEIVPEKEANENSIYGSEAVICLRKALNLPDVSFSTIPVGYIMNATKDLDMLNDILSFILDIEIQNRKLAKLIERKAPILVLRNEYEKLQEAVEYLLDNDWYGDPFEVKKGKYVHTLASLKDLGFKVRTGICRV